MTWSGEKRPAGRGRSSPAYRLMTGYGTEKGVKRSRVNDWCGFWISFLYGSWVPVPPPLVLWWGGGDKSNWFSLRSCKPSDRFSKIEMCSIHFYYIFASERENYGKNSQRREKWEQKKSDPAFLMVGSMPAMGIDGKYINNLYLPGRRKNLLMLTRTTFIDNFFHK